MGPVTSQCAGYTLLELLVVMAIAAVLVGAVGLSVGDFRHREAQSEALMLKSELLQASDEAEAQGAPIRIELSTHAYRFSRFDAADKSWHVLNGDQLKARTLLQAYPLTLVIEDKSIPLSDDFIPGALFMTDGESTSFTFGFADYTFTSDGLNPVRMHENTQPK